MPLSSSSNRYESNPNSMNAGFSEVNGAATNVSLNLGGKNKIKKGATLAPVVNLTDQGAINAAMAINDKAIRSIEQSSKAVTDVVKSVVRELRASGDKAVAGVVEAGRGDVENISVTAIKYGALALAAFLVVRAFAGGK